MPDRAQKFVMPQAGEVWRHFKGTSYLVHHVGIDCETGAPSVAYFPAVQRERLSTEGPDAVDWAHRGIADFLGSTKDEKGANVNRFRRVVDSNGELV